MSAAEAINAILVIGAWHRDGRHLVQLHAVYCVVELDLVEHFFCCANCQQLLSLRIRFPLLSIFLEFFATFIEVSLFFIALLFVFSVPLA